ncbi:MAG TPA: amidohydrolase family protein, partial [Solirubrobacteraceae bacterium]
MRVDIHQHLFTEPVLTVLARRETAPRLVRRDRRWELEIAGEPASPVDPAERAVGRRIRELHADGIDRAVLCPSLPLGVEALPPDEARALLRAYHQGVDELPRRFATWASVPTGDPDPAAVAAPLDRGAVGLAVPARAIVDPATRDAFGPALELLARRDAPLMVHPGPADAGPDMPAWWPAMTSYVAQMNAAWHAFVGFTRPQHPRLRVVFALLAGGAPFHLERLAARGGPVQRAHDPLLFYDTSSYGQRAIDTAARFVGVDQLVHGSDRPMAEPPAWAQDDAF